MALGHDIPICTWLMAQFNIQFQKELEKNSDKSIKDFFDNFLQDQKIKEPFSIDNQGAVVLYAYGLLVVPKELWEKESTNFAFHTRAKFLITVGNEDIDSLEFLKYLRHSIAHANFDYDIKTYKFTFWNIKQCRKDRVTMNFKTEIDSTDFGQFLSEVGKFYIEVKNSNNGT